MRPLFDIDEQNNVVLHKQCYRLCPELEAIDENELIYIIKAYDYNSPYRQFPVEQRKRKALVDVYGTMSPKDNPEDKNTVVAAMNAYKGLQYDVRRDLIQGYTTKIAHLQDLLMDENGASLIKSFSESIERLEKQITKMDEEIKNDIASSDIKGGGELSFLESMQDNLKAWRKKKKDIQLPTNYVGNNV